MTGKRSIAPQKNIVVVLYQLLLGLCLCLPALITGPALRLGYLKAVGALFHWPVIMFGRVARRIWDQVGHE